MTGPAKCGWSWRPPWIPPPGHYRGPSTMHGGDARVPLEHCSLPAGHDGDHRSDNKVTARNDKAAGAL